MRREFNIARINNIRGSVRHRINSLTSLNGLDELQSRSWMSPSEEHRKPTYVCWRPHPHADGRTTKRSRPELPRRDPMGTTDAAQQETGYRKATPSAARRPRGCVSPGEQESIKVKKKKIGKKTPNLVGIYSVRRRYFSLLAGQGAYRS